MTDLKKKSERTRNRLLTAASRIFAEKGFQEATIAEICEQAQTNIASVNYHFRDKETLYLESWRFAFNRELSQYPPDGGISRDAAPEKRLAALIHSLIERVADEDGYAFAILYKEMARPTRLLADILEKEIEPQRSQMFELLRECLGQAAEERHLQFCHDSIMGQCFQLLRLKQIQLARHRRQPPAANGDIKAYADHVVQFSLAGIQALRSRFP
ncbi:MULTISPECIES: TetR/AcrR family transcriptional regulator [Methylomicrobium]|uniref:Transcriptional regulator n=1 Tax=Methylomicrobium album BG8 TaxID=686340 RepID=H8GH03_METAL|nr:MULTISPECIES: CerR family C-terminal domain-containing protein [Methylomicrobium]EIC31278.1 transcriptional regulator [Methylomicrobium album BG8]